VTKADDIKIKPGIAYYYGVFSVRAGVASPSFASTGPHLKMEKRPNFYIILELDPSITDWSTIQAAIQDKRRSWSTQRNQGTPDARRKAER